MKIYVSHARRFEYESELYQPLKEAKLLVDFIFPHEEGSDPKNSKELFQNNKVDYVLAEVSYPATGQGIELAWAQMNGIPIICVYKKRADISSSLKYLTDKFIEYEDSKDLVNKLTVYMGLNVA